jgi:hypothetical protein
MKATTRSEYLTRRLVELEGLAGGQGVAWTGAARPGLGREEIFEIMAGTGLEPGPCLLALFQWHDGIADHDDSPAMRFLPTFKFPSLRECVALYDGVWRPRIREIVGPDDEESYWPRRWFPVLDIGDRFELRMVMLGLVVSRPATDGWREGILEEVRLSGNEPVTMSSRLPSLIAFIELWLSWMADGSVSWDAARNRWLVREEARHRSTWAAGFGI